MTASIARRCKATDAASGEGRHGWWRRAAVARTALAAVFVGVLLGLIDATGQWAHLIASLTGFATAITLIAVGIIGWERVVGSARSAGLVQR